MNVVTSLWLRSVVLVLLGGLAAGAVASSSVHRKPPAAKGHGSARSAEPVYTGPGVVRVLPGTELPANAVLPPARGYSVSSSHAPAATAAKPAPIFGAAAGAAAAGKAEGAPPAAKRPTNEFYIVNNPELRWQQYSYP
ncbi:hypothetical protein [Chitinilyticum piscinae]|uniref:Uncharacterized protein n=1 Tax=Chitinilyticum piscinae TaxID=2866724 RepID=A0A8J7FQ57_9NEIS|nr:hypothetical protein [Chitinilyticum piscinae]MBE9608616.1 hypothetical protein [Chitinilyticum piscinae]